MMRKRKWKNNCYRRRLLEFSLLFIVLPEVMHINIYYNTINAASRSSHKLKCPSQLFLATFRVNYSIKYYTPWCRLRTLFWSHSKCKMNQAIRLQYRISHSPTRAWQLANNDEKKEMQFTFAILFQLSLVESKEEVPI